MKNKVNFNSILDELFPISSNNMKIDYLKKVNKVKIAGIARLKFKTF